MIIKKYNSILEKPKEHREKWANGLSILLCIVILFSWVVYRGFFGISFSNNTLVKEETNKENLANIISADLAPSPTENTKNFVMDSFGQMKEEVKNFKSSIESVFVPFITGIDVYNMQQ